jgi:dolichol-phosphate mannosyltransferase
MKGKLSLIIPILNEEKNIIPLTKRIIQNLKKIKYEIIFVDDGSTDNSQLKLKVLKKKYKFFRPILRNKKKDLTQSCFDGVRQSKFENILVMDGDLQHDPKYIKKMFKIYKKYNLDIVIGSRKLLLGKNQGLSELRRFTSIMLIYFFRIFKIKTNDPMSGFFIFKKEIYYKNKKFFFGKGFKILADFLINSKQNLKTRDIAIDFNRRYNSESKMSLSVLLILIQFYLLSLVKKIFN